MNAGGWPVPDPPASQDYIGDFGQADVIGSYRYITSTIAECFDLPNASGLAMAH